MLEYLLYRAGFFDLEHKNLCRYKICGNHYKYLTTSDRKENCKLCKAIRQRPTASTSYLRPVTKSMALQVWQKGRPAHTWTVYGKATCASCRSYFEASNDTDTLRSSSDHWFGEYWKYIMHLYTLLDQIKKNKQQGDLKL